MERDQLSARQAAAVLTLFLVGSGAVFGADLTAGRDSWLSLLGAVLAGMLLAAGYARLLRQHAGYDLYDLLCLRLGGVTGRLVTALFTGYALYAGAVALRSDAEFLQLSILPRTPQLPLLLGFGLLGVYALHQGVRTVGRCSLLFVLVLLVLSALALLLALPRMHPEYLLPLLQSSPESLARSLWHNTAYPFGETVLCMVPFASMEKGESQRRAFLWGTGLGGALLLLALLRNLTVLGLPLLGQLWFPSHTVMSILQAEHVVSRLEGLADAAWMLAGFVKITVCLHAAAVGAARLTGRRKHRPLLFPVMLLMAALSLLLCRSTMELMRLLERYPRYAWPLWLLLPLLLLLLTWLKRKRSRGELRFVRKKEPRPE